MDTNDKRKIIMAAGIAATVLVVILLALGSTHIWGPNNAAEIELEDISEEIQQEGLHIPDGIIQEEEQVLYHNCEICKHNQKT